jgi:hypothetical protein
VRQCRAAPVHPCLVQEGQKENCDSGSPKCPFMAAALKRHKFASVRRMGLPLPSAGESACQSCLLFRQVCELQGPAIHLLRAHAAPHAASAFSSPPLSPRTTGCAQLKRAGRAAMPLQSAVQCPPWSSTPAIPRRSLRRSGHRSSATRESAPCAGQRPRGASTRRRDR